MLQSWSKYNSNKIFNLYLICVLPWRNFKAIILYEWGAKKKNKTFQLEGNKSFNLISWFHGVRTTNFWELMSAWVKLTNAKIFGWKYNLFHRFPRDKSSKTLLSKVKVNCRYSVYHLIPTKFSCMEFMSQVAICNFVDISPFYISPQSF